MSTLAVPAATAAPQAGRGQLPSEGRGAGEASWAVMSVPAAAPEGEACACDLVEPVGRSQPTVSHHLKLLRAAGLIGCERHGLFAHYFVNRGALAELRARILVPLDQLA